MSTGEQLQVMSAGIDTTYKLSFISKTQKLLDDRISEMYAFLDASLEFQNGNAMWRQDLPIIDLTRPESSTNPLMNPEIPIQSAEHAYDLFKNYFVSSWFSKRNGYERGIADLEKYCRD